MIAYRSPNSKEVVIPELDTYKEDLVSCDGNYIVPNFSCYLNSSNGTYNSWFKRFDNTPELYDDIYMGDAVFYCAGLLANCLNFNKNVHFSNLISDYEGTFYNCSNFNQPINLEINAYSADFTKFLQYCDNFNSDVHITSTYPYGSSLNCSNMLSYCMNFNSNITFSGNLRILNFSCLLSSCVQFNRDIIIPEVVNNVVGMFGQGSRFYANVYIKGTNIYSTNGATRRFNATAMFSYKNWASSNAAPAYIHCHESIANILYNTNLYYGGTTPMQWTELGDGNGWYNTLTNIYLYNNYSG